jgi:hypothetical protein
MKNRLLGDEFPSAIANYVYNSEYSYDNREFEYINKFELKCLEQFNVCKSLYESLNIWDKDEVIKYWVNFFDFYSEDEVAFLPKHFKSFNLLSYYSIDSDDSSFHLLVNTDPYPIFYLNYYILKFRTLLINFFLFEEQCNLEALQTLNFVRTEFNPKEFLNLSDNLSDVEAQNEVILPRVTQKTIVCFFQLLRDSEIRQKGPYSNKQYCQILCREFNIPFKVKIAKLFSQTDLDEIIKVKIIILPTLSEDIKTKLENYIIEIGY